MMAAWQSRAQGEVWSSPRWLKRLDRKAINRRLTAVGEAAAHSQGQIEALGRSLAEFFHNA